MTSRKTFVLQTTLKKNNPRKHLCSIDGETVESDAVEGEKSAEAANVTSGVPVKGSKHTANHNYYRFYPHHRCLPCNYQQNFHNSESQEKKNGSEVLRKDRASNPGPMAGKGTLLYMEALWALTVVFQLCARSVGE